MRSKGLLAVALVLMFGGVAWAGDFSEYRLRAVLEGRGAPRLLESVELHATEVPPRDEAWAPETYFWFQTDPEAMIGSKGENPGVHVFSANLERVFSAYLTEDMGYCRELYFNPGATHVVMEVGTGAVGTYILTDMADVRTFEVDGIGPCIWIDPHRFLFTRFEDNPRGIPAEVDGRFSVEVYDPAGPGSFPVKQSTELSNYILKAVEGDTVIIEEDYVDTPKDWQDMKIKTREIRLPLPAAG